MSDLTVHFGSAHKNLQVRSSPHGPRDLPPPPPRPSGAPTWLPPAAEDGSAASVRDFHSAALTGADRCRSERVGAGEQVAQRPSPAQRHPDPPPVLRPIMQQVTPLAERPDVAVPAAAMRRIVVEMRCREHDLGRPHRRVLSRAGEGALRPLPSRQVCSVSSHQRPSPRWLHNLAMRPAADLAAPLGPDEPDPVADLRPVDRVEVAQLRLDRHGRVPAQASRAAVRARGRWR